MTDRYHTLTVVLEENVRDEDARSLIDAIKHMRGVIAVDGVVADSTSYMAEERARFDLGQKLLKIIYPKNK